MGADVDQTSPYRPGIGLAQTQEPLHDFFADQVLCHLAVEFAVEPRDQAAHLGALLGVGAEQWRLGVHLVQKFAD